MANWHLRADYLMSKSVCVHRGVSLHSELTGLLGRSVTPGGNDARANQLHHGSLSLRMKGGQRMKEHLAKVKELVPELAEQIPLRKHLLNTSGSV